VFAETMVQLGEKDPSIMVLEADLMRANGTGAFAKRFPDRSINLGVAEANMVGVAAGLSAMGKIPFACTFASFAGRRDFDQFFISANYARLNVKLVGTDPGVLAGFNGGTHMPFEDIGLMRTIPRLVVVDPCDGASLRTLLPQIAAHKGSVYLRLNRKDTPVTYPDTEEFTLGKAKVIQEGKDIAIFASGAICVPEAKIALDLLADDGISAALIDVHTIKPIDAETVITWAKKTTCVLTCENHQVINGLGSAVAEVLGENCPTKMARLGIYDEFGQVGEVGWLVKAYHLDAESIAAKAKRLLGK